jgi:SAM-dependent methyltransferase
MACARTAVGPVEFTLETLRGIGVPAFSCGAVVVALLAIPGVSAPLRIILAAAAGGTAYLWLLVRFGSTPEERQFVERVRRLPRELLMPVGRAVGARSPSMRSLGYLALSLRAIVRHPSSRSVQEFDAEFEASRDPWGYGRVQQRERINLALQEVERIAADSPGSMIESVLEIGCAEGTVTELVAPRCRRLVAVDLSSVALARCKDRCGHLPGVEFRTSDAVGAATWGPYQLVIAMDVLECIRSPFALARTRDAIVGMLSPGGHLLVTTTRQHPVPESACWGRWIPIGARINEFVARHPGLERVRDLTTATHAISLYRKIE